MAMNFFGGPRLRDASIFRGVNYLKTIEETEDRADLSLRASCCYCLRRQPSNQAAEPRLPY
jgi:hypothetical protein